ncbi:MAG TPA: UDP-galactopyranose mutase [Desulfomonilia bacterium]
MKRFTTVIVGAGFAGIVAANRLSEQGGEILLIEQRQHIGGNSYDCYDDHDILIHLYGPHILHTKSARVWNYLSQYTDWRQYDHHVQAHIDGIDAPLPFNLNTIEALLPSNLASRLVEKLIDTYGYGARVPILKMREHNDNDIKFLAEFVYEKVFLHYTVKQWGIKPDEIDPSVTARVPVLVSRDDRYFQDTYQGIPKHGYTRMFERMIDRRNIHLLLNTDYKEIIKGIKYDRLIYTGPLDYYFDYKHGKLPYRSLRFDFETLDMERFQSVAVVNYPNDHAYTRITEFKHFSGQEHKKTTILREFPEDYEPGRNVPSYAVYNPSSLATLDKYKKEMEALTNILFLGRLAEYRYYNMDEVVDKALDVCDKLI